MGHLINPIIFKISFSNIWNDFFFCSLNVYSFIINKLYEIKSMLNVCCTDEKLFVANDLIFNSLNIYFSDNKLFIKIYFYDAGIIELSQNLIFYLKFYIYYNIMKGFWTKEFSETFNKNFFSKYCKGSMKKDKIDYNKINFIRFVNIIKHNFFSKSKKILQKSKIFLKFLFILLFFFLSIKGEKDMFYEKYLNRLIKFRKTDFDLLFTSGLAFVDDINLNKFDRFKILNLLKWYKLSNLKKFKILIKKIKKIKLKTKYIFFIKIFNKYLFLLKILKENKYKKLLYLRFKILLNLFNKNIIVLNLIKKKLINNLNYNYTLYYGILIIFNLLSDKNIFQSQDNYNVDISFLNLFSLVFFKRIRYGVLSLISFFFKFIFKLNFIELKFIWFIFDNDSLKSKLVSHHIAARIELGFRFKFFVNPIRRELRYLMREKKKNNYNFLDFKRNNAFTYLRNYYSRFKSNQPWKHKKEIKKPMVKDNFGVKLNNNFLWWKI